MGVGQGLIHFIAHVLLLRKGTVSHMGGNNNTLHLENVFIASEVFPHTTPYCSLMACLSGENYHPGFVVGEKTLRVYETCPRSHI